MLLLLAVAFLIGSMMQEQLGISFSAEGLQDFRGWVQGLGWLGPGAFVLLVVFRLFIGLSSHIVLILGGLAFGVTGGVVWGCVGLFVSALVLYYLAQLFGVGWVERRFGEQHTFMLERVKRVGALAIFAITAHPVGLLTPAHLAAGVVDLGVARYSVAVALAAPIRTAPYVFLGTAILDLTLVQSLAIGGVMMVVFVVPLLSPKVRGWMWGSENGNEEKDR